MTAPDFREALDLAESEIAELIEALSIPSKYNGPVISTVRRIVAAHAAAAKAEGVKEGGERAASLVWDVLAERHPDALVTLQLALSLSPEGDPR